MKPPTLLSRARIAPSSASYMRLTTSQPLTFRCAALHQRSPYLLLSNATTATSNSSSSSSSSSSNARRHFSQGRPSPAAMGAQMMKQKTPPTQSRQTAMNDRLKHMTRDEFPDDFGLLPGTFVRPVWSNLPSIFRDPKGRLKMEWQWLRSRVLNLFGLIAYFLFLKGTFNEPLYKRFLGRKKAAKKLHKEMYTALAEGDRSAIERLCCIGLRNNFNNRIAKRGAKASPYTWTLHSYINFPKSLQLGGATVISDRGTSMPVIKNTGVRQIVVRIRSKQSLEKPLPTNGTRARKDESGKAAVSAAESTEKKIQNCTEYVVLQKLTFKGKEDREWKVWGLAKETTLDVLEKDPYFAPGLPLKEKIASMTDNVL